MVGLNLALFGEKYKENTGNKALTTNQRQYPLIISLDKNVFTHRSMRCCQFLSITSLHFPGGRNKQLNTLKY